jgi:hypothetical protein
MPKLSDPKLEIEVTSGSPNAAVTASVDVSFSSTEKQLIDFFKLKYKLTCRIRAADIGNDNALFTLGNVEVTSDRNDVRFSRIVSRDALDEDNIGQDEVYARFWCTPPTDTGLLLAAAKTVDSPEVSGSW